MKKYKIEYVQTETFIVDVYADDEKSAIEVAGEQFNAGDYQEIGDAEVAVNCVYDVTDTDDPFHPSNWIIIMKKEIGLSIMYTPWTIDTYATFDTEREEEMAIENYNEEHCTEYTYDDFDWEYDHKGLVKCLAENWQHFVNKEATDEVIEKVELDGEPRSPREYNFATDDCDIIVTVDYKKLRQYVADNKAHFEGNKIKSTDGFMWLGDDDQAMLHYYLWHEAVKNYSVDYYMDDQLDRLQSNGEMAEFVEMKKS